MRKITRDFDVSYKLAFTLVAASFSLLLFSLLCLMCSIHGGFQICFLVDLDVGIFRKICVVSCVIFLGFLVMFVVGFSRF